MRFMVAYLKGARFYTDAFDKKDAAKRTDAIDIIAKATKLDATLIGRIVLPNVDPDGKVNVESMLDIQKFFVGERLALKEFPAQRLLTNAYSDYAVARLGPFGLQNPDSKLAGCR